MLVWPLRLYSATPSWAVRCGCVCLGSGFGCAPPLLAAVLGPVCVCVCAPLVPRHSWRGCAVCVYVLGLGFRLRPVTPGRAVGVCVCLCARSACTRPLLAWVCGVGVCAWLGFWLRPATPGCGVGLSVCLCAHSACTMPLVAWLCGVGACAGARVSAAPRHSWLGCWGVCVLVYALRLYPATPGGGVRLGCLCLGSGFGCAPPLLAGVLGCVCACCALRLCPATPGWGVRCGCVCLGSGFGCAPPLLAGVLGPVCACVAAPLVPRHSWLGCAVRVCVLGLGFRLRPATPGWGVGACVCLCARSASTPPLLAGVCGVAVCAWARASAAPNHSWLGCWGVCVFVCALRLYHATCCSVVRCGCVCWGSGFGCAPPLLAGVLGPVCACVAAPLVPRHSWLGCAVRVCVLGLGFRLRPATAGWGFGACVCLCARSASTPPLLAGVCGVAVCAWARASAAPHHSWLGCWGVCVFVCAVRLYHATCCSVVRCGCVCWGSGFGCTPPLLAGVLGCVCACVRTPPVPRHSWLGCAARVFVLGLGFRLRPPLLAGVLGCVCAWCALRLCPATPGWGVRCGRVCFGSGFSCSPPFLAWVLGCACLCARSACTPPLLAGVCGVGVCAWAPVSAALRHSWLGCWGVCVFVCALRLYPAPPRWGVRRGCVCLGSGFGCAPPLLAGVLGCVCACVGAPLVPRHSWLGCAVWVCVLGLRFWLRPATPGWGGGVCVCVCVLAALVPRHSWLGCAVWVGVPGLCFPLRPAPPGWGVGVCVCVCLLAPLVPRHSWLGCVVRVCVLGLGFRLRPVTPGRGVGVCVCLCARSACTPPLLAWVCGVGVCAWLRFWLRPATPGCGVGLSVCLCAHSACTMPLVARLCGLGVCAWAGVSAAPRHSWLGCWGVCVLVARSACAPPLLAGVCGVGVCAWVRVLAAPRHSWLGFWGLCVLVWPLRLYPGTSGWGVRCGCVCLGSGFGCAPPLLAGVLGPVCVCVRAPLVPRHS